jgi:hypothetical protein
LKKNENEDRNHRDLKGLGKNFESKEQGVRNIERISKA